MRAGYFGAMGFASVVSNPVIPAWWDNDAAFYAGNAAARFLKIHVVPHGTPLWQIASALNTVIAIAF